MTYARRTDSNQREIVSALRQMGYSVAITSSVGDGFPDLVVGKAGATWLIELKSSRKAGYTEHQTVFMRIWTGSPVVRLNSLEEAIDWAKKMPGEGPGTRERETKV